MSNRPMARFAPPTSLRPGEGYGREPSNGYRDELTLVIRHNPYVDLTDHAHQVLSGFGVDGHWLFTLFVELISKGHVNTSNPRWLEDGSFARMMLAAEDVFTSWLIQTAENEGLCDDQLAILDAVAEEEVPSLIGEAEPILFDWCVLLSGMRSPPGMRYPQLDKYLVGYSMNGMNAGYLHFQFRDYETDHSL